MQLCSPSCFTKPRRYFLSRETDRNRRDGIIRVTHIRSMSDELRINNAYRKFTKATW